MRWKQKGAILSLEVTIFLALAMAALVGTCALFGSKYINNQKSAVMMQEAEHLDKALIMYGRFHRGVNTKNMTVSGWDVEYEKPPIYPTSESEIAKLRDYKTGYFADNILIETDTKAKKRSSKVGVYYYIPYQSAQAGNNAVVNSSHPQAFAYDLYVKLPNGQTYYTQNSKSRMNKSY